MATTISTQRLGIQSSGTLDKNKAAMEKGTLVTAQHYDEAQTFLRGLDSAATVRIVNGRSKNADLTLSTQSNKGNFYSRKPITTAFFKQACIAKFSNGANQMAVEKAFDQAYQTAQTHAESINSAGHFRAIMDTLEAQFSRPDLEFIQASPVLPQEAPPPENVNNLIRNLALQLPTHEGESHDPAIRNQLIDLLKTGVTEPASARADFLREHLDTLSSLFYFESTSVMVIDELIVADLASLRNERDALPEMAQIKSTLDTFEMEYTNELGDVMPMPWYFMRGNDGSIAALDHSTYSQLQLGAPNDKLMENVQIFSMTGGDVNLLNASQLKKMGAAIIDLYPPLHNYFNAPRAASASSDLAQQVFKHDSTVNSWLQLALKGVRQELSDPQRIQLGDAFMRGAESLLQDLSHLDTPARWPEAKLKDDFIAVLRLQANNTSQLTQDDERGFAHFLFALSATFTRLSSVNSLGDDAGSITQLRYLGYVLLKTAQTLQSSLLSNTEWTNLEKRFLDANSCAAVLSSEQFSISKTLDAHEFLRFVPPAFQSASL